MTDDIKLQTPVKFSRSGTKMTRDTVITGIGSCFAERMTGRLFDLGMEGCSNPTGIVYNAVSIADAIRHAVQPEDYAASDFFEYNGLWHSWEHHGSFSNRDRDLAVDKANNALRGFREKLKQTGIFILTPSSSVVYRLADGGKVAANCHKVPQNNFRQDILSVEQNRQALMQIIDDLTRFNPCLLIVITLSPVRHYPGNLTLNARSKANLLAAIHECIDICQDKCVYFPSYEIVMDELRDYRYFNEDMVHPSDLTTKIIYKRFLEAFFDVATISSLSDTERDIRASAHRPLH